jgi:hypothetical protein
MRAVSQNARATTLAQAKSEFADNLRTAIDGINTLTENLEKMRAVLEEKRRSAQ